MNVLVGQIQKPWFLFHPCLPWFQIYPCLPWFLIYPCLPWFLLHPCLILTSHAPLLYQPLPHLLKVPQLAQLLIQELYKLQGLSVLGRKLQQQLFFLVVLNAGKKLLFHGQQSLLLSPELLFNELVDKF